MNAHNRDVEKSQAWLKCSESFRRTAREEQAKKATIRLRPPRMVIIQADERAGDAVITRQVRYVGTSGVISNWLADIRCSDLGKEEMLRFLNEILRTQYTMDRPGLSTVLQSYVDRDNFDFGLAYGFAPIRGMRLVTFEDGCRKEETYFAGLEGRGLLNCA